MPLLQVLRPTLPILIGASLMLSLSMGLRQSLGIFLQPLTHDVGISVSDFTLAIAVQNLAWGFLQPLAGAMTVRYGFRTIMMVGAVLYVLGLALMAGAQGLLSVMLGAGVLIGTSLACTAAAIAMSVAARAVPATVRSTVLGIVSAAGSLGALLSAPIGQMLNEGYGWRTGLVGFVVLSLAMLPAAWFAGKVDRIPLPEPAPDDIAAWYFMLPPSPATTLLFGAIMGFLWLGVGPLVAGAVADMFGLKWQAMIQGLAFMSHQLGSFLGAYGGGLLYDALGSYTMAWRIGVALGLAGGIIQVAFALVRPSEPPLVAAR